MTKTQPYPQTGIAEPKRWRVALLDDITEERARQVEEDYRRAFDTHQLDEVVQAARRPRLSPGVALAVLVVVLAVAPFVPANPRAGEQLAVGRPAS